MAIVYSKTNQKNIDNAIKKACQVKPRVKATGFGHFAVTGSKGDTYHTHFYKNEAGEFTADCTCPASKKNSVCYHLAATAPLFKGQVNMKAAEKAAPISEIIPTAKPARRIPTDVELEQDSRDLFGD